MTIVSAYSNGVVSGCVAVSVTCAPFRRRLGLSRPCFYTKFSSTSIPELIAIFHHRWSAPVLAELLRQRGSRFAALAGILEVGRESLRRTLDSLLELGLVARNPGYGHPLRPEYVLTRSGEEAARRCARLLQAGDEDVLLRKWSLPVLAALTQPARFSELRGTLPGVTPRALALALKELQAAGLVERRIEDAYPPTAIYAATRPARRLQRIVG
jgi:DNA-binding HxlR family transcriptional regulator